MKAYLRFTAMGYVLSDDHCILEETETAPEPVEELLPAIKAGWPMFDEIEVIGNERVS